MEDDSGAIEPAVDRWTEGQIFSSRKATTSSLDLSIFNLSGGVMRTRGKATDEIDGLLDQIIALPSSGRYSPDVDRNLDYLFTSLQLDFIRSIAERCPGTGRLEPSLERQVEEQ